MGVGEYIVHVVDDEEPVRKSLAFLLTTAGFTVRVHDSARNFLATAPKAGNACLVTDLRMPDMSGIEAITVIRAEFPHARIIVLTTYAGDVQAAAALKAGASGYLLKNLVRKELIETIRAVHSGKRRVPPEIATEIAEHVADDALTDREVQVLRRVAAGKSNKLIAAELDISEGTVKTHMKSILPKLDASDRTHAVMIALKRGILDL